VSDDDYVLGTDAAEIDRLGRQHAVWRPCVLDAWRRAGLAAGQTALDVGCGPGFATLDLAAEVGEHGRVVAIDRSRRFLERLEDQTRALRLAGVDAHRLDLDADPLPAVRAHFAWCRWVLTFVRNPRRLLDRVADCLVPGGTIVIHEYFDYAAWRFLPDRPELADFVSAVMASWRAEGGEPDVGRYLPHWLHARNLDVTVVRPLVHVLQPADEMWSWPAMFLRAGLTRLVTLGAMDRGRADAIERAFSDRERDPHTLMVTPAVLEVVGRRPASSPLALTTRRWPPESAGNTSSPDAGAGERQDVVTSVSPTARSSESR
jgi:SAM-dependent methyltransferase